ncbi:MAG: baseplate protein [Acidobacteria bacterium]|nr:MAG: baseplate protein [Acidobacteriota bacterium]
MDFLGKGLKFPVQVDASGALDVSEKEGKIRESVFLILSTALGERQMRFEFGSPVQDQVFAPIRSATLSALAFRVQESLIQWEPRIEVLSVQVADHKAGEGVLLISVDYRIRATNTRFNLVYPFFVKGSIA